jgi:hypothetical protein
VRLDLSTLLSEYADAGSSLYELLTAKQRAIEDDLTWIRAVCGGRQWGKTTWSAAAHALASIPGAVSIAAAPSVTKARDLLMPGVEWLANEAGYRMQWRASDWEFVTPIGGRIKCMGIATTREAEKVRGYTPPFVTVEECGTFRGELLQYALESCIVPSQVRWFRNGGRGCALIGTPGITVRDYWHELCQGMHGASVHHATMRDNPFISDPDGFMEAVLRDNGWTVATPRFRREYLGQFCAETESMCYAGAWDRVILPQTAAPPAGYTVIGIDLGASRSPSAWVVMRITRELVGDKWTWITHALHAEKVLTLTVHDVAAKTYELRQRFAAQQLRGDAGGLGELALTTIREKFHGVPIERAHKAGRKLGRIWLMSSMLQMGILRIYEGAAPLADEILTVPWDDAHEDHHQAFPDHACDAAHYALEVVEQWTKEKQPAAPEYGTTGWMRAEMARHKRDAIRRHEE